MTFRQWEVRLAEVKQIYGLYLNNWVLAISIYLLIREVNWTRCSIRILHLNQLIQEGVILSSSWHKIKEEILSYNGVQIKETVEEAKEVKEVFQQWICFWLMVVAKDKVKAKVKDKAKVKGKDRAKVKGKDRAKVKDRVKVKVKDKTKVKVEVQMDKEICNFLEVGDNCLI